MVSVRSVSRRGAFAFLACGIFLLLGALFGAVFAARFSSDSPEVRYLLAVFGFTEGMGAAREPFWRVALWRLLLPGAALLACLSLAGVVLIPALSFLRGFCGGFAACLAASAVGFTPAVFFFTLLTLRLALFLLLSARAFAASERLLASFWRQEGVRGLASLLGVALVLLLFLLPELSERLLYGG
ncbi:MAG: hypothetical protein ACSW8F_00020 [bacterium]